MIPVLEAVPNFSSGRDPALVEHLCSVAAAAGAEVVDRSADPDHNRCVLTLLGAPAAIEEAAVALALAALESIDLSSHQGAHPRIGALDVLPFVPLSGLRMADAVGCARRVGRRIASEVGVPVYYYAEASSPPGRSLSELRQGGFEALAGAGPHSPGRPGPDEVPDGLEGRQAHPTAGAVCVGARPLLLAWNVDVVGIELPVLRQVAAEFRQRDGGFEGLRTLALELPAQGRLQMSMNLEEVGKRAPFAIFQALENRVRQLGGGVSGTEIIGLCPDELLHPAGAHRLRLLDPNPSRVVSSRLVSHLHRRLERVVDALDRMSDAAISDDVDSVRTELDQLRADLFGSSPTDVSE